MKWLFYNKDKIKIGTTISDYPKIEVRCSDDMITGVQRGMRNI
jgi:hypothetical protein